MKQAKRWISALLVLCLCLSIVPIQVHAAYENTHKNTGNQRVDIIEVAKTQLGYTEGNNNYTKYGEAFGSPNAEWCAFFISWCSKEAGISDSIIHRQGVASPFSGYFNIPNTHSSGDYFPQPGDLVFYGPNSQGNHYHVGLVETVNESTGYITTIEGNTNSSGSSTGYIVYRHTRHYQASNICCYGVPNYQNGPHTCDKGEYVFYEEAHPHYKCYRCSICGTIWRNTVEPTYVSTCSSCVPQRTSDSRYSSFLPIGAYTISTGRISVYDAAGNAYSNQYIDGATDLCLIMDIYTDGWCKVRYTSKNGESGYHTAYVPLSTFTASTSPTSWTATDDYTTYKRSDLQSTMLNVSSGSNCLLLKTTGSIRQIIHPVSGQDYFMMGWINDPKRIHTSTTSVDLTLGGTESAVIYAWSTGSHSGNTALFFQCNNSNISCSWGSWTDGKAPLTIVANTPGTTVLTIGVKDKDANTVLDQTTISVRVISNSYTVSYNANGGSGAPSSQTKVRGTALTLSTTTPTRFGYTFLGWSTSSSATSPEYYAGSSFSRDANTTLYAVWSAAAEISGNYAEFTRAAPINNGGAGVYFKFIPYTTTYYRIYGIDDRDTRVYLYDASGNQLGADDDSGDGNQFQLDYYFTGGQTYYIYVRYYSASQVGSLDFKVAYGYQIKYNANGGTGAPGTTYKFYNFDTTLSTAIPTREGYSFAGWSFESGDTQEIYMPGDTFSVNTNTTLYAVWREDPPTITASTYSVRLNTGVNTSQMVNITMSGTYNGTWNFRYQISDTSVVSASWGSWDGYTNPLTITAKGPGATDVIVYLWDVDTEEVLDTLTISVLVFPTSYTISYNANGGSGAPDSQTKPHGTALTLSTTVPTRFGCTFLGWSTSSSATSATYLPGASFTTDANTTLYAVWQSAATISSNVTSSSYSASINFANGYKYYSFTPSFSGKIRFESTGNADTIAYLYNSSGMELTSNDDGGEGDNFQLNYGVTSGTTYYLKVKYLSSNTGTISFTAKRVYDITYNANGGSGAPSAQEKVHGTSLTLSPTAPTRSGYAFQGWATSSSATSASYQPGGSYTSNSGATLYAVWTQDCSAGHSYSYRVTTVPTTGSTGQLTGTCSRCGGTTTVTLPKLDTTNYTYREVTAATCTTTGIGRYTWKTTTYGNYSFDVTIPVTDHDYEDGSCIHCGEEDPNFDDAIASGYSGDIEWRLTDDGVLAFYGTGKMKNYSYKSEMPWYTYMDQIESVVIEDGVTSIGDYAFYGFEITSIEIPESVTSIGNYAFKNAASLDDVVLPSNLSKLGESAFYACSSLSSIEIPASLWTIQPYTFKNCTALTEVIFNEGNLQKISDGAFYNTALTSVELPDCLAILDVYVFKNCSKLADVKLSASLTQIREASLYGTAISSIEIPEGVTSIKPYAFKNCVNLVNVSLPRSLTIVDEAAFYACEKLASIDLPDAVSSIGNYAFRKCTGLTSVEFGSGLVTIGESSFYGCTGIRSLSIPRGVTTIKGYAFKGCTALTNVGLPTTLTNLGESAFHSCTALNEIIIPAKVSTIGEYCFSGSTGIRVMEFLGNAPAIGSGAFNKIAATAWYPGDNATWTSDVMQNYGGNITWKAQS